MKRAIGLTLLGGLLLLGWPRSSEARITAPGFSTSLSSHTVFEHAEYEYYFNNSGGSLTSGTVVVVDRTGTGVNVGGGSTLSTVLNSAARSAVDVDATDATVTNIGTVITTTTAIDSASVVGVVDDDSCLDQTYCRVQVYGPRIVRCADSTDAVTTNAAVGTTSIAGYMGGGTGLGVALSACRTTGKDNAVGWVFIRPGGNN